MKTTKLPIILSLLFFTAIVAMTQNLDEYEQWKKRELEEFQQFKDERDKAFTEFLKQQWREMQLMQGLVPDEKPKPQKAPVYIPPADIPKELTPDDSKIIKKIPIPEPTPEVQPELILKPTPQVRPELKEKPIPGEEEKPVPDEKEKPVPEEKPVPDTKIPEPTPEVQPELKEKPVPGEKEKPVPDEKEKPVSEEKPVPDAKIPEPTPEARPELKEKPVPSEKEKPAPDEKEKPVPDEKEKPVPEEKPVPDTKILEPAPEVQPELREKPVPGEKEKPIPEEKPVPDVKKKGKTLNFNFFDASMTVHYDDGLKAPLSNEINKETISAFWEALSRSNYDDCITQAQYYRTQMKLNDWGYCLLLHNIGETIYHGNRNQSYLFVWYMLSKSGYSAKIGYNQDKVYLLLPSANTLYGVPYFTYGNDSKRFYVVSLDNKSKPDVETLYTYDGTYPGADKLIDLTVDSSPNIRNMVADKRLKFNYKDKDYALFVKIDKNAVDFFEDYPQTNLEVYFDAPLSPEASLSLLTELKPIIEGKSEVEAVNILLRFVQTAFAYKIDEEQFGREKYLFPEESLFYNYSDCEDRSAMFAYLVRKLIGLEVIGLDFPGHIATAVKFNTNVTGDYVMYQNQKYIICDPTYINADLGMCMPQFKNATLSVIHIK